MTNPGPTKEDYDSLVYKLATLESELGQERRLLEAPAKLPWWKRYWGVGSKAAVVVLVASVLLVGVAGGKGSGLGVQDWRTLDGVAKAMYSVCRKFFPQRGVNGHYTNRSREQVL